MIRFLQTEGPVKKIVLSGLLLLICAAMVIAFIPGNLGTDLAGSPGKGIVAKVNGEDITAQEVRETARGMLQQQGAQLGANAAMLLPFFAQRAADQLVDREALVAEAQRLGFKATPDEIKDELQHGRYGEIFFPGGTFIGQAEYQSLLQQHDLTVPIFEASVGKEILISKLQALITGSASVSDNAIRTQFDKQNTKVKFDYAVLSEDEIKKGLHPTNEELKAFYAGHQKQYANSVPEKRKVKYATIDLSKVESGVQTSQDDVQSYYNQHRDQYRTPEQAKVSHILIKTPLPGTDGKVDQKGVAEAQKRAEDLLKQLKGGANFAELAKKYSEDPGSAKEGGSLGWIGKGRTVPEFEKASFSQPIGQIGELVKSSYGFHIIRVDERQDAHMKSLAEVKEQIEPALKQQKAQALAQKQADDLLAAAKSQGLEKASAAKNLTLVSSDFFAKTDSLPGLGPSPDFMSAVFAAGEKSPTEEAKTSQGFAVFDIAGIKPASTPTFDDIHAKVEEEFKNERANILLTQKAQELSDRAKADHDLKKAAKELGATYKASELVAPDGQVPDIGSMTGPAAAAFTMKPGEISGPINSGTNGVVLAVTQVQAPTDTDFSSKRDQIRDSLLQSKEQQLFGLFMTNLRAEMEKSGKIKINQDELKTLTRAGGESGI